jgi:hypothetical protein
MVESLDISFWVGIIPMAVAVWWPWAFLLYLESKVRQRRAQRKTELLMQKYCAPVTFKSPCDKEKMS